MTADFTAATTFDAPLYVAWELTHQCNAKCVHCYSDSGPDADCSDELPLDVALSLIDQLAEAGVLILAFSGGEPLLHRHWRKLVSHALTRGIGVNIGTNGSCITERVAKELKTFGVKSVTVSIDSHLAEVHDNFRRLEGLHKRALRAIRHLVAQDVRVVVGFTPTRLNWTHGQEVVMLAHRLGAAAVNLSEYVPAGRGSIDLALSPNELHTVLREWIELREQYLGRIQVIWHDCRVGLLVPDDEKRKYVGCGAGRLVARILPNGTLTPCVFLPTPLGSFRDSRFCDMWGDSALLRQFREREGHVTGNCGDCEHLPTCGGCRAVAHAYSGGDPLAGDPHCWIKEVSASVTESLSSGEGLPV
jgi:radical SAM protein with 4Fe4S-binding SPASM domain